MDKFGDEGINLYWAKENTISPWDISFSSNKLVKIKCQNHFYHGFNKVSCNNFSHNKNDNVCPYCKGFKVHRLDSFAQYHINNTGRDFLEKYWDYKKNDELNISPWDIRPSCTTFVWIKCQEKDYHGCYYINCNNFTNSYNRCPYCNGRKVRPKDSFAQHHIDNTDPLFIDKYWSDKNVLNPFEISKNSHKLIYIKCQKKDYHVSCISACLFTKGIRCQFCASRCVHKLDSLGYLHPEVCNIWSSKNKNSPYNYSFSSAKKVWWKCENNKHKEYKRSINISEYCNFRCPKCVRERKESFLQEKVRKYISQKYGYELNHEYDCSIVPRNPKTKCLMPFDNEIIDLKLIIEVHGSQHYQIEYFHKLQAKNNNTTPEQALHKSKLYDRYKRLVAHKSGYFYLEVPYWTEKDGSYKKLIDDKIDEIRKLRKLRKDKGVF